jgi:hypothetical protein
MRIWIRDSEYFDPGYGMEKFGSGIRDKHPGSATLVSKKVLLKGFPYLLHWSRAPAVQAPREPPRWCRPPPLGALQSLPPPRPWLLCSPPVEPATHSNINYYNH